ncbi:DUF2971 domain-containing protein [Pantoea stewartii]|uniref:DUF2971 domain-containing protein n=1 Tax=Pantoea stewartii TaxID=66269 RepID=UPI003867032F
MGLEQALISKNLNNDQKIWRYMSLDKLVNLLDTKSLYFSPIRSYKETDPFEGLLPKSFREMLHMQLTKSNHDQQQIETISTNIFNILGTYTVNCWHQNNHESEAMWQLYSDNKKGVAIQSSIGSLRDCIVSEKSSSVILTEVQYLDLYSDTPFHSGFNGVKLIPAYKRLSFKHEHEVRLIYKSQHSILQMDPKETSAEIVDIDPSILIEKIYISPYTSEPYGSSVRAVLKKFGFTDDKIISSTLLTPDENLKRLY